MRDKRQNNPLTVDPEGGHAFVVLKQQNLLRKYKCLYGNTVVCTMCTRNSGLCTTLCTTIFP